MSVMDVDSCVVSGGMAASPFAGDDPMTCRGLVQEVLSDDDVTSTVASPMRKI